MVFRQRRSKSTLRAGRQSSKVKRRAAGYGTGEKAGRTGLQAVGPRAEGRRDRISIQQVAQDKENRGGGEYNANKIGQKI